MKSLDDKIAELRKEQSFLDVPLQELIRMDAVCLALRSLIDALKETERPRERSRTDVFEDVKAAGAERFQDSNRDAASRIGPIRLGEYVRRRVSQCK